MEKTFISPQALLATSFELVVMIYESAYSPTHIIGVWRGGAPIAIAVHEGLTRLGHPAEHFVVQAVSYGADMQSAGQVKLFGIEAVAAQLNPSDRVLIVDDIFDTGLSIAAILSALSEQCGANLPREIKTATAYYKPMRNQTQNVPNYFTHKTENWVVFPHELMGCSDAELRSHKALPKRFFDVLNTGSN